jgi:hypothetical protein
VRLDGALLRSHTQHSRYGETTRIFGLAACRVIIAFGRGYYARATELIGALPASAPASAGVTHSAISCTSPASKPAGDCDARHASRRLEYTYFR